MSICPYNSLTFFCLVRSQRFLSHPFLQDPSFVTSFNTGRYHNATSCVTLHNFALSIALNTASFKIRILQYSTSIETSTLSATSSTNSRKISSPTPLLYLHQPQTTHLFSLLPVRLYLELPCPRSTTNSNSSSSTRIRTNIHLQTLFRPLHAPHLQARLSSWFGPHYMSRMQE